MPEIVLQHRLIGPSKVAACSCVADGTARLLSGHEDGIVAMFDGRTRQAQCIVAPNPQEASHSPDIAALAFHPTQNHIIYVTQGPCVHKIDLRRCSATCHDSQHTPQAPEAQTVDDTAPTYLPNQSQPDPRTSHAYQHHFIRLEAPSHGASSRLASSPGRAACAQNAQSSGKETAVCHTYTGNKDDVGCITINDRGSYMIAGDDSGEAKVFDIKRNILVKTLRGRHSSCLGCAAFLTGSAKLVATGGMDNRVTLWDASSGASKCQLNLGEDNVTVVDSFLGGESFLNPPMAHSFAQPGPSCAGDMLAVGRGDGRVSVHDVQLAIAQQTAQPHRPRGHGASKVRRKRNGPAAACTSESSGDHASVLQQNGLVGLLGGAENGHGSTAVGGVAFLTAQEGTGHCRLLVSAGNDRQVLLWDVGAPWEGSAEIGVRLGSVVANVLHGRKANAVAVWGARGGGAGSGFVVADTSRRLSAYTLRG